VWLVGLGVVTVLFVLMPLLTSAWCGFTHLLPASESEWSCVAAACGVQTTTGPCLGAPRAC
jgi:hypothetical protein